MARNPIDTIDLLPPPTPLRWTRGDTLSMPLQLTDERGIPLNLTGTTITLDIHSHPDRPALLTLSSAVNPATIIITNPLTGSLLVSDSATNTAAYGWHSGTYRLRVQWADGTTRRTVLRGPIHLLNP